MAPLDFSVKITFGDSGPGNKGNGASCENKQAEKAFPGWPLYTLNTFPLSAASQNIFWANSFSVMNNMRRQISFYSWQSILVGCHCMFGPISNQIKPKGPASDATYCSVYSVQK